MRQLPSGRVVLIDVMPMVVLLQKANRESNPSLLDFVDDIQDHYRHFRVTDLGRGVEGPDNLNPLMDLRKPKKGEKSDTWKLSEIMDGDSSWPASDVNALKSSLSWSPMKGWMRIMLTAVEHLRDSLRERILLRADALPITDRKTSNFRRCMPPRFG